MTTLHRAAQWPPWQVMLFPCAIGLIGRLIHLTDVSYWFDESSSWKTIQFSWTQMLDSISHNVHPPVYYICLRLWAIIAGDSPLSLRLFSILLNILTIASIPTLLHQETIPDDRENDKSAHQNVRHRSRLLVPSLLAGLLMALSPAQTELAQQARMYTLTMFWSMWTMISLMKSWRHPAYWFHWATYSVLLSCLSLTHYFGAIAASGMHLLLVCWWLCAIIRPGWSQENRTRLVGILGSTWLVANIWNWWLPVFMSQQRQVQANYWIPELTPRRFAEGIAELLGSGEAAGGSQQLIWLPVAIWGLTAAALLFRPTRFRQLLVLMILFPLCVSVAYSLYVRSIYVPRYLILSQVYVIVGVAALIGGVKHQILRWGMVFAALGWMLFHDGTYYAQRAEFSLANGLLRASNRVEDWSNQGEPIIVASPILHPSLQRYSSHPERIHVIDRGFRYAHYLGGPLLRQEEYIDLRYMDERYPDYEHVVVVFSRDLFGAGNIDQFQVPTNWEEVRSEEFVESYRHPCTVIVKVFRRPNP